ncbi:LEPR-XLL domain-containing protein [Methylobacterium durans]|uniref:Uncharacterized protein n=1 Tax=Methylobacterium durans TaxID=2202825 RepID=A0A2U8W800_9HYPH|nr:LEPR-XLL domain-containing protein [Methylobacterium durans]AWN41761.1 hypothetical protein DK389_16200 [Methylobacterium durans]
MRSALDALLSQTSSTALLKRLTSRVSQRSARARTADLPDQEEIEIEAIEPRILLSADSLTGSESAALLTGLAAFRDLSARLDQSSALTHQLPIAGQSLAQLSPFQNIVADDLLRPASTYLNDTSLTHSLGGLAQALQASPDVAGSVTTSSSPGEDLVTLSLQRATTAQTQLSLGPAGASLALSLAGTLPLSASATLSLTFGLNTQTGEFFIRPASLSAEAHVDAHDLNVGGSFGFVDVTAAGAAASLDAAVHLQIGDAGSTGEIKPASFTDLAQGAAAAATLSGAANLHLPLTSSLLSASQTLDLHWAGVTGVEQPTDNLAALPTYQALSQLKASDVARFLGETAQWLGSLNTGNLLGGDLPIFGSSLGSLTDVGGTLRKLFVEQVGSYNTVEGLVSALGQVPGLSNVGATLSPSAKPGVQELTLTADYAVQRTGATALHWADTDLLNLGLDVSTAETNLTAGGGSASGWCSIRRGSASSFRSRIRTR